MRVPLLDPTTASGEVARFFEATSEFRGRVPNSARTWAHVPHVAKFFLLAGTPLQREGAGGVLSCRIKEMAVLKTSHANACRY
jgi:hypothetical protein